MSEPLLTPAQVADQLCLSIGAVTRALREGRIPGYKLLGVWRIGAAATGLVFGIFAVRSYDKGALDGYEQGKRDGYAIGRELID